MRGTVRFFLCSLMLLLTALRAEAGVLALGTADNYNLTTAFSFYEDVTGRLDLPQVMAPPIDAQFRPLPGLGAGSNFGLTSSAIWLRVKLVVPANVAPDWLLEVAYPPLDRLDLYTPGLGGGYERQRAGDLLPFASRIVAHRNHVLPVTLVPGTQTTLYLRIESEGTVSAPTRLWRPAALWQHDQGAYAALALYFGLVMGLLLYNQLLYASIRDVAYLIYVAFVAGMACVQATLTGLAYQFVWPQWTWWNSVSPPASMAVAAIFAAMFTRTFLSTSGRMPVLDKLIQVVMFGWMLALLAALALPYVVSSLMVTVLAVASVAILVMMGGVSLRRGYPGARYFLIAWTLLLLGVVTLVLHNTGVLPSNPITANGLLIGSALEMVMLSFALADRINVAQRFKDQAQARIAAEHAMVETLSQSQERLRTVLQEREIILENSMVGIAFLNRDGRFRWANQTMLDIFGARRDQVTSMEPFYLSRTQYLQVGGEVAAHAARGQAYEKELEVQQYDGTKIWISLSGKAVSRRDLNQGTVWVVMNITERKLLEEQLRKTSSEREAILNSALVGIVMSVARRHEWVNDKFAQMLGYPRQVLIGQTSDYIHPDHAAWERFGVEARAELIATGSYTCERKLKRRDGTLIWVAMGGSCLRPNDPDSGVIWTFLDISGRKKSEEEMIEALEQQKALNELRTRFVAMTSHEFRTPLAAILSAEELLRHYGDRLPQSERLEILDSISAGVQRMSRMMDRVLLLGKADAQMLDFKPQKLDLLPLCRQFVDEARAQQPDSRCEVALDVGPDVGEGAYDEKLLRHIFGNLLSNALKYSPEGGRVSFEVRKDGAATVFCVADSGIGIPAEELAHLFESFHRASNVGAIQGTGLGLAIVKNAVDMHRGTISVTSELGRGTTFTVRLPLR